MAPGVPSIFLQALPRVEVLAPPSALASSHDEPRRMSVRVILVPPSSPMTAPCWSRPSRRAVLRKVKSVPLAL